jgi:hypothetical protein
VVQRRLLQERSIPIREETRRKSMSARSCLAERLSSFSAGAILLVIGALIAVFSVITLPFIGLLVGVPLMVSAVFLIVEARRAECPL